MIFVAGDGSETTLRLQDESARIGAMADALRLQVAPGAIVGMLCPTGPDLVLGFVACIMAGCRPLIIQYPTRKQSRAYWTQSVRNIIGVTRLAAIIADDHCVSLLAGDRALDEAVAVIPLASLMLAPASGAHPAGPFVLPDFEIIQLSSGTTGHRKAMAFRSADLHRHAADLNSTLQLGDADTIVSWLPLYHDMGYIACFVMPLLLGIRVVMMDPMVWVQQPGLLFEAIAKHRGTVCYMPNFGFEVMCSVPARALPGMRWWISCSEPVSPRTSAKFIEHVNAGPDSFSPCYAMAENIFAVSIRRGLKTAMLDHGEAVCCGEPIKGVSLKIVDGEIWVRSPTSIASYLEGTDIRDADGFYPTGDLGALIEGELFVTGRKQDILLQAGRKFMLSDIDLRVNEAVPEARGRVASLAVHDERLGTESLVVLIESADFFTRSDHAQVGGVIRDAANLDHVQVDFVPPRFLTKTSSGKMNRRKSAADWLAVRREPRSGTASGTGALADLRDMFKSVAWDRAVPSILDSLSLVALRLILAEAGLAYDPKQSLSDIAALLERRSVAAEPRDAAPPAPQSLRIVSLADRQVIARLGEAHLAQLSARLGVPVTIDHVCLPPAGVLLSDCIFHDYFQPRLEQEPFASVDRTMGKLHEASLLIFDDVAEMLLQSTAVYGVLSHALERSPGADLVSFRWPSYPRRHHLLPLTVVSGADLPLENCSRSIEQLGAYLKKPVFRVARLPNYERFSRDWEYRPLPQQRHLIDPQQLVNTLAAWIEAQGSAVTLAPLRPGPKIDLTEPVHFCSNAALQEPIDALLASFDRFCIVGQQASLPYLQKQIEKLGKSYVRVTSFAPEAIASVAGSYDCMLICGAWGPFEIDGPAVAFQNVDPKRPRVFNLDWFQARFPRLTEQPPSGDDWFYPLPMGRRGNRAPQAAPARVGRAAALAAGAR